MPPRQVMITGGDGYIGLRVAKQYLEKTDEPVLLWVHAAGREQLEAKRRKVLEALAAHEKRITLCSGDLVSNEPFQGVDPAGVRIILHTAAVTRFNVDEETATKVNLEGAGKLMEFAGRCPSLEAFGLLSTVYASGLKGGPIPEEPLSGEEGFANHYERSKWSSENLLLSRHGKLPWRIYRVATAIADDESGRVTQQNAFHNTLKLFFYGLLSLIPGKPRTPLYFVTGQFVAESVFELMRQPDSRVICHVAHAREESLTLGELLDLAFETFMEDEDFKLRRILKPLYTDAEAFDLLARGVSSFGGGVVNQAISSVAPFARQLFIEKEVQNGCLVKRLKGYRAPDPRQLIRNTCAALVRTRWGRTADAA